MDKKKFYEKCLKKISIDQDMNGIFNYSISIEENGEPVETGSDEAEMCFIEDTIDDAISNAWIYCEKLEVKSYE